MELQANQLLEAAQAALAPEAFERLKNELPTHAEGIVDKCQDVIYSHTQMQRDLYIDKFKSLCERYSEISECTRSSAEKHLIEESLKDLAGRYEDDPEFMNTIKRSEDKAVQKAAEQIENQDLIKEQTDTSRGFER